MCHTRSRGGDRHVLRRPRPPAPTRGGGFRNPKPETRNPRDRTRDPKRNNLQDSRTFALRPRPESDRDCRACAIFARTRRSARCWSKCAGLPQFSRARTRSWRTPNPKLQRTPNPEGFRNRNIGCGVSGGNNFKGLKDFYPTAKARIRS